MSLRFPSLAAVLATLSTMTLIASLQTASAGMLGCPDGRAVKCYQKVATPDVYETVTRPVIVAPAHTEVVDEPAVIAAYSEKVQTTPPRWLEHRSPAQYGIVERTVQVRPASVRTIAISAQYGTVHETIIVKPAAYRWERQIDWRGHETMCKIRVPAVTRQVARTVQLAPATHVSHVIPATYQTVQHTVQVAAPSVHHTYIPANYDTIQRDVVIRPAHQRVVRHPPVIVTELAQVLVQRGGTAWQPISHRLFD